MHRGDISRGQLGCLSESDLPVMAGGKHPVDHAALEVHGILHLGPVETLIMSVEPRGDH